MKRFLKILRNIALSLLGLLVLLVVLVNFTPVQNFLARRAAAILSDKLQTRVSVAHVRIDFLNHALLQGLYIEDRAHDTLLYAGEVRVRITDWFVFKKEVPVLRYVGVKDAYGHLYRTKDSAVWNYQFVIDAFDDGKPKKDKQEKTFEIDLQKVAIENVRFHMDDAWGGTDMDLDIGAIDIDAEEVDLKKKILQFNSVEVARTAFLMRDYTGGKPPSTAPRPPRPVDSTPFNGGNWAISTKKLELADCRYARTASTGPAPAREFDPDHIDFTGIALQAGNLRIRMDTLTAKLEHLAVAERCGMRIMNLQGDVSVSPNASVVENMLLETPNSVLRDYYAMRYERFPAFTDYINAVRMEARLRNSVVDFDEIGYFASVMRERPARVRASGDFNGTVADFSLKNFDFLEGGSEVSGELLTMTGLPDIYNTFIHFKGGRIASNGADILRYEPSLRGNPDLAIEALSYLRFRGGFTGYLENFAANGTLETNLGNARSDVEIRLPLEKGGNPSYSGTVSGDNFALGRLLRKPYIGSITFKATVSGNGFDPQTSRLGVNAEIPAFSIYGYNYRNISAEGVLAKQRFDGKLFVNDTNLSATFLGTADFTGAQPRINAEAHVLYSNPQQLRLISDPITLAADFNLNAEGSNIDNFLGDARLYNINLVREDRRLDVDSIAISSQLAPGGGKIVQINSNLLSADISGNYALSKLPNSAQYFVSQYLPNYIPRPKGYAPDQDITFDVTTHRISTFLGIFFPQISGFDNASVQGNLNTTAQQMRLALRVPQGRVDNLNLHNIVLDGEGDFRKIALSGDIGRLQLGDSLLDLSANISTTVSNDSVSFNLATTSALAIGNANLNGSAYALGDSLYVLLQPSDFFLNGNRWEIPGGSRAIVGQTSLYVNDLFLRSGIQQIAARTNEEGVMNVALQNIDLSQLGAFAGLAGYQPDGRINGSVDIRDLFTGLKATGQLDASSVRLGVDTIGDIHLAGSYDALQSRVEIEEGSGIFRGNSSINTTGKLAFGKGGSLDAKVVLRDAPLQWLSPFLHGYVSELGGSLNGSISLGGSPTQPDVGGTVEIDGGKLRLDYLGTRYTIPKASIGITNTSINIGTVTLKDVYNNSAALTGTIRHQRFQNFNLVLNLSSEELEVVNLQDYENNQFYGHLIASTQVSVRGPVDDIAISITKAIPQKPSQLYLPMSSSANTGAYNYISFKKYGEVQQIEAVKSNRLSLSINALANPLLEIALILDATTGDRITAKGNGNINLEMPAGEDIRLYGNYAIEQGVYTFTFRQLFYTRDFLILPPSSISFSGPIDQTNLDIYATYRTRASLYDLLTVQEKEGTYLPAAELADTKRLQDVLVNLRMVGKMSAPTLSFKIELPEKRSVGTIAYSKLDEINRNDRDLFNQVASLLLIGYFIPREGISGLSGASVSTGGINNLGQILSTTTSQQLTNIVNKLLGDQKLSIELKYKSYNLSEGAGNDILNRNEVKLGVRRNFFNDRLIVEAGSSYDWGRPNANAALRNASSNFNLLGDFRLQYLLSRDGRLRLNAFNTSNYDALAADPRYANIRRGGLGISWRRTFDNWGEFWHPRRAYILQQQQAVQQGNSTVDSSAIKKAQ